MQRLVTSLVVASVVCACSSKPATPAESSGEQLKGKRAFVRPTTSDTKVLSFTVSTENLRVDKVGVRNGTFRADGNLDLAFTATIDGPFDAIFVYSTNAKGEPAYGLRADTLARGEEVPSELGSVVDTGSMTVGVGVFEDGRLINLETGRVRVEGGTHTLSLYTPNPGMLKAGDHIRLWVRAPNGALVASPVAQY